MKLTDIIDLAKQGYKPSDIKELIELSESAENDQKDELPDEGNAQKNPERDQDQDVPEDKTPDDSASDKEDDALDYKSLYEAEKTKNATLQKMIMKVDISGSDTASDQEIFADVMKNFM